MSTASLLRSALILVLTSHAVVAHGQTRLVAPAAQNRAEMAISQAGSGGWWAFGSPGESGDRGAAQLYLCSGQSCAHQQRLAPGELAVDDRFGVTVAIDGSRLAVAAPGRGEGAVYLFQLSGGSWSLQQRLDAPAPGGEAFGSALALTGNRLFVGAPKASAAAGAVHVYTEAAGSWTLQAQLDADDPQTSAAFGSSLAVSGSGLLVGAPGAHDGAPGSHAQGAAYVLNAAAPHAQLVRLQAPTAPQGARYGSAVAIGSGRLLIGAPKAAAGVGNAVVYDGSGASWSASAVLNLGDGVPGDRVGWSVALQGDQAVIGAPFALAGCGRVLSATFNGVGWGPLVDVSGGNAVLGQLRGYSVAL
ncbi:MAG: hypothetical protein KDI51_16710, partial [Xanthomonadales bacterium]|nr:hypothetical protein [Xanthomonadales bacterium]